MMRGHAVQPGGRAGQCWSTAALTASLVAGLVVGCGGSTVLPSVPEGNATPGQQAPPAGADGPTRTAITSPPASPPSVSVAPSSPKPTPLVPTPRPTPAHWVQIAEMPDLGGVLAVQLADGRVLAVGDGPAALWDPRNDRWRSVDGLVKARKDAGLVALGDGRAMIVGGTNSDYQSYSSAYLFEPSSASWTKTGLMDTARSLPAVVELADGRVLVAGGEYERRPDGWGADGGVTLAVAGPEDGLQAPAPDDVEPEIHGRAMATAEVWNPATGTWSTTGAMRFARYGAAAVRLADGRVLVVGSSPYPFGIELDPRAFTTAEIYDPATGRFKMTASLPGPDPAAARAQGAPQWAVDFVRQGAPPSEVGSLVALPDGGAVLIGNSSADHGGRHQEAHSFRYDVATETWSEIGEPWFAVYDENASRGWTSPTQNLARTEVARLGDSRVLVVGAGASGVWERGRDVLTCNPRTNAWRTLPRMPSKLGWWDSTAVSLLDGSVLLLQSAGRPSYRFVPRG